ncbi:MAG: hypothetical protein D6702_05125 [Planctomycetota bacterium]|nr:MAG: hypothetical protein D6702_05125 [Planctomycetota bacterium]
MQGLFAVAQPVHPVRARTGLTRWEALWILLLAVGTTLLILGTLRREMDRARARRATDAMDYLAGHLFLGLGEDLAGWPEGVEFLRGPGEPPAGITGAAADLVSVLPPPHFLPVDPWGRAYVVEAPRDGRPGRVLCAGPDGDLATLEEAGRRLERVLLDPPPAAG